MSVLVVWRNIVNERVTSVYMASDSRFSFGQHHFDHGKKVFACKNDASLFGYCGGVEYATYIIQSVVDLIEAGVLYKKNDTCETRVKIVTEKFGELWKHYYGIIESRNTEIVYCTTATNTKSSQIYLINITKAGVISFKPIDHETIKGPRSTDYIQYCVIGSGGDAFSTELTKYYGTIIKEKNQFAYITSRVMFQILSKIVKESDNSKDYGGFPQLAYIYNNKRSRTKLCGVIFNDECCLGGCSVEIASDNDFADTLKWFNENFELCDPHTKKKKEGAQTQPYI